MLPDLLHGEERKHPPVPKYRPQESKEDHANNGLTTGYFSVTFSPFMLKYLAIFAVILGLAVYISVQDERAAEQGTKKATQSAKIAPVAEPDKEQPQENIPNPGRHSPSWYRFFRWPESTTLWAVILTLCAIADQARLMAKHAGTFEELAEIAGASNATAASTLEALERQAGLMQTQAGYMENQTKILADSVAVAKTGADAAISQIQMMKDKERARLEFELDEFAFHPKLPLFFQRVNWKVRLYGQTEATILEARITAYIGDRIEGDISEFRFHEMGLRRVLSPTDRVSNGTCMISPNVGEVDFGSIDKEWLKAGNGFLYCAGRIAFVDVFGERWVLPFHRRWEYALFEGVTLDEGGWGGSWGEESQNAEQKAN
jgi:hypothetical protein